MLKEFLLLAIAAFSLTGAMVADTRTADLDLLHKQTKIYELFMFIDQTKLVGSEWFEYGKSFDLEGSLDMFDNKVNFGLA